MSKEIRTSVIKKLIKRTIQPTQFESFTVEDGIEEIIEWTSLSERDKKIENWDTILLQRFTKTFNKIVKAMDMSHKTIFLKNPSPDTISKVQGMQTPDPSTATAPAPAPAPAKMNLEDLDTIG